MRYIAHKIDEDNHEIIHINEMETVKGGAKTIVKAVSTALANADIVALMFCSCIYDGTNFVLLNPRVL